MFARLSPVALRNLDDAHLQALAEQARGRRSFSALQRSALRLPRDLMRSSTWRDAADLAVAHILILDSPAQARLVPYVAIYYPVIVELDHLTWARLLRTKIHDLTFGECKLGTVIAVARALFMQPTMHVSYDKLRVYEAGDRFTCIYYSQWLLAEAWALGPGALAGFTVDVRNTDAKSAWRELVNF